ncbi:MAG TPA: hypothetical protein VN282_02565 [Pyrinomonadaceae bacterium]|nr:hypothetical protein [Pyrinomonadaceae bacterium]
MAEHLRERLVDLRRLNLASQALTELDEHGVFYMAPVVTVTVSLFLAYTLFVAVLIALG